MKFRNGILLFILCWCTSSCDSDEGKQHQFEDSIKHHRSLSDSQILLGSEDDPTNPFNPINTTYDSVTIFQNQKELPVLYPNLPSVEVRDVTSSSTIFSIYPVVKNKRDPIAIFEDLDPEDF